MLSAFSTIQNSLSHLLFPHNCLGCATDILNAKDLLCAKCYTQLPATNFATVHNNPIEKTFYGRLHFQQATASFYYTKDSLMQHLLVQLKYKGNKEVGVYFGKLLGQHLMQSNRFGSVDALIALPLNPKKEFKRGYNQAMSICQGIEAVWQKPIINNAVIRKVFTKTQTRENRINRWHNMDGVFAIDDPQAIEGKHILLVDDVVTTGATLEACGSEILKIPNTQLSIATVTCTIS
jgi:ComF family protein